jgi:hypothetical protein
MPSVSPPWTIALTSRCCEHDTGNRELRQLGKRRSTVTRADLDLQGCCTAVVVFWE